jgi:hypothetical protein
MVGATRMAKSKKAKRKHRMKASRKVTKTNNQPPSISYCKTDSIVAKVFLRSIPFHKQGLKISPSVFNRSKRFYCEVGWRHPLFTLLPKREE